MDAKTQQQYAETFHGLHRKGIRSSCSTSGTSPPPRPSQRRLRRTAVNALWPRTTIATAAIKNLLGGDAIMRRSRTPDILADAAYLIFTKPAKSFTGQFLIDDTFLAGEGVTDFDAYRVDPSQPLSPDFFVPDSSKPPPGVSLAAKA